MDNPEGRKRALDRLMFFSDAVAAIAATLLILPLVDDASAIGHRSVGDLLSDNWPALFAFALSFAVIYRFWIIHHHLYENVNDYSEPLLWANGLWLISIVFMSVLPLIPLMRRVRVEHADRARDGTGRESAGRIEALRALTSSFGLAADRLEARAA